MKATSILATAAFLSAVAIPIRADDSAYVEPVEPGTSYTIEMSTRIGVRKLLENDWAKPGPAVQFETRANLFDSPFDVAVRGYYVRMDTRSHDTLLTYFGGNAVLQLNLNRGSSVNPFVAMGVAYEHFSPDDGNAFVGRGGLEFVLAPFFLLGECGWMSECYKDSDDAQLVASVRAGWSLTDFCRIDVGTDYYAMWKDIFVSAGLGFTL